MEPRVETPRELLDVLSTHLFRLAPDVRPGTRSTDALAFMLFMLRYDVDVRMGVAKLRMNIRPEES